jgi:hypothetical protein
MITATITVDDSEILPLRRPLSSPLSSTGSGGAHRVAANRTGGDHDTEARNLLIAHLLRSHAALPWPGQTCATSPTGRTGAPPACRDGVRSGVVPMARLRLRLRPGYAAAVFVRRYAPNEDGWARRDSNPQGLLHRILNPARLPIPPLAQCRLRSAPPMRHPAAPQVPRRHTKAACPPGPSRFSAPVG